MAARDYDLVVYGATGFTGRQAATRVLERGGELRWCIAGRNEEKLLALRQELGLADLPIEVVDAMDADGIDALVARTRVVLTTAGPYVLYGDAIIEACARHGTHYVDITGETTWVADKRAELQETAVASGAKIVPFCGFDSVPSDLGVWFMVRALAERGTTTKLVRSVFTTKGGFNGGTMATMLTMGESGDASRMTDRELLTPPELKGRRKRRRDPSTAEYIDALGVWTTPFFMALTNTRVVRWSEGLDELAGRPYGPEFEYEERMYVGKSGLMARAITLGMGLAFTVVGSAWGRSLLARFVPKPGEGPSEDVMDGGHTEARFLAEGDDGTVLKGRFVGVGDPGNRVTVAILVECALSLVHDQAALPGGTGRVGFLPPAHAFGSVLLERLLELGFTMELEDAPASPA